MTKKQKKSLRNIIISAVIFVLLIIFTHIDILPQLFHNMWITLILYLVPYLIVGFSVIRKAVLGIAHKQLLDESFLMTIATIGAFATGEYSEAVAVMLFYQVGEFFQQYAVKKSRNSIKELMDIAPETANLEHDDGSIEEIFPDEVEIGNILVVKPGEKIPVDGVVTEGSSFINTSALTGESVPRSAKPGDSIISGCINGDSLIKIRATKIYEDSTVAKILELVENASEKKSVTENFITRFARYYTPIVVICALILAIIPPIILGDPLTWIYRACTFLVISCPCALVISVPLSFFGGIGAASKNGVLVKGSNYLELMASIHTIVTDKTGTLTKGEFKVNKIVPAGDISSDVIDKINKIKDGVSVPEDIILTAAYIAEQMSTHPIALSIKEAASAKGISLSESIISDLKNVTGKGVIANLTTSDCILAGNESLIKAENIDVPASLESTEAEKQATIVHIAFNNTYLGKLLISDTIKENAAKAISKIKQEGVKEVIMLTGDLKSTGEAVGHELNVTKVYSELLPEDKVNKIEEIIENVGEINKVAFIGDGINDAPVLSRADVGIAMGSMGSDAAIEAADIVIMDDNLMHIPAVIKIARKTVGIARQNIIFALFVKILILILGALGIANMWAAVFADVGVAVICILNSMRMLGNKKY
ncbi:MAG: heavy metal translocating P-type ATPase [Lachnospiraceae bacterium]|nr:heavy metal translocating P-type ATPase [Lachnospiraceae bacterium]